MPPLFSEGFRLIAPFSCASQSQGVKRFFYAKIWICHCAAGPKALPQRRRPTPRARSVRVAFLFAPSLALPVVRSPPLAPQPCPEVMCLEGWRNYARPSHALSPIRGWRRLLNVRPNTLVANVKCNCNESVLMIQGRCKHDVDDLVRGGARILVDLGSSGGHV